MTEPTDIPDVPGDETPTATTDAAIGAALATALEDRAGGPVDVAPVAPVDERRFAEIEAAVAAGGPGARRTVTILAVAAAAIAVVLVGSFAVARDRSDTDLHVGDGSPSTSAPAPPDSSRTVTSVVPAPPDQPDGGPITPGPTTTAPVGSPTSTAVAASGVRAVDVDNFTYPRQVCDFDPNAPDSGYAGDSFTLVGGQVQMPDVSGRPGAYFDMRRHGDVVYGDVTGDGDEEALVTILCGRSQSDNVYDALAVIHGPASEASVIGALVTSGTHPLVTQMDVTGEPAELPAFERLLAAGASGGQLTVRWNFAEAQLGPKSFPQREVTVTYRWDGRTFAPAGESDVVTIPPEITLP